jgi:poly-gamma-glutamate capsule biosynthesis protein CapA/YwtB (metallophosphatase superfamily)
MENSEVNDYIDTLDETIDVDDETSDSLLGQESGLFTEEVVIPQAPVVSMDTLPITGEARVDDALGRLADLQGLPVHEHVDVFEDVQRRLHETLADLAGQ